MAAQFPPKSTAPVLRFRLMGRSRKGVLQKRNRKREREREGYRKTSRHVPTGIFRRQIPKLFLSLSEPPSYRAYLLFFLFERRMRVSRRRRLRSSSSGLRSFSLSRPDRDIPPIGPLRLLDCLHGHLPGVFPIQYLFFLNDCLTDIHYR